jgi:membrane protein implicated in regulation of membrane protease activity
MSNPAELAATVLDAAHIPVAIIMVILSFVPRTSRFAAYFWAIVAGLQIAFLNCPLVVFIGWLRGCPPAMGTTYWLYRDLGPWVAIPIFAFTSGVGLTFTSYRLRMLRRAPESRPKPAAQPENAVAHDDPQDS